MLLSWLRELAELLKTSIHWLPGTWMIADPLTKRLGNSALLRAVMERARYGLTKAALDILWVSPLDGCETERLEPQSIPSKGIALAFSRG